MPNLQSEALILASGPLNLAADQIISDILKDFIHEIIEIQRIDISKRTIIALRIKCDPAHAKAIMDDLERMGAANNLDVAMELI